MADYSWNWGFGSAGSQGNRRTVRVPATYTGGVVWYDATQTTTGAVASWTDLFGNGFAATQGTGSAQPINTANQINGRNALVFSASNSSSLVASLTAAVSRLVPFSIFTVFKYTTSIANQPIIASNISANDRMTIAQDSTNASLISATYNGSAYTKISTPFTNTTLPHILTTTNSAANSMAQYLDNVPSAGGATPVTSAASSEFRIGGSISGARFNGLIGELIIYNRAFSTTEITSMNSYLANKWGVII